MTKLQQFLVDNGLAPKGATDVSAVDMSTKTSMTNQEAFDRVCRHLKKQRKRAMKDRMCINEDEQGNRCAVACLIDGPAPLSSFDALVMVRDMGVSEDFLIAIRDAHDGAYDNKFRKRLRLVGKIYGLDVSLTDLGAKHD